MNFSIFPEHIKLYPIYLGFFLLKNLFVEKVILVFIIGYGN